MARTNYFRKDTCEVVGVHAGLDGWWVVGTLSDSGSLKRIKSKALPPQRKPWAMQAKLDRYAEKKGWVPENPDGTIPKYRFFLTCYEHGEVSSPDGRCPRCGEWLARTSEYLGQVKAEGE